MVCSYEERGLLDTAANTSPSAASLCLQKRKLSGTSTSNMAIMQGQNLRNLYSLIFGKYSEPQERLSIAMYIIGNGTDFAQTQSPPLFRVAEPRNRLCRQVAELLILCLWRSRDAELKPLVLKVSGYKRQSFLGSGSGVKFLTLCFFIKPQNKWIVLPVLKILSEFLRNEN